MRIQNIPQKIMVTSVCVFLLTGCSLKLTDTKTSKLELIPIEIGMKREKVEEFVAQALEATNEYSPYGNNLRGGILKYTDTSEILEVTYNTGIPTPWVINKDGFAEHYQPVDESVKSFRVYRK
jgi:hypothetical protein